MDIDRSSVSEKFKEAMHLWFNRRVEEVQVVTEKKLQETVDGLSCTRNQSDLFICPVTVSPKKVNLDPLQLKYKERGKG